MVNYVQMCIRDSPKIVSAIAEARDKGDLSENAEYDAAKEAQGLLEMKISQLKSTIGDAKIIDTSKMNADVYKRQVSGTAVIIWHVLSIVNIAVIWILLRNSMIIFIRCSS